MPRHTDNNPQYMYIYIYNSVRYPADILRTSREESPIDIPPVSRRYSRSGILILFDSPVRVLCLGETTVSGQAERKISVLRFLGALSRFRFSLKRQLLTG